MSCTRLRPSDTMLPLPLFTKSSLQLTMWLPSRRTTPAPWSTTIAQLLTCRANEARGYLDSAARLDHVGALSEGRVAHERSGLRAVGSIEVDRNSIGIQYTCVVHLEHHPRIDSVAGTVGQCDQSRPDSDDAVADREKRIATDCRVGDADGVIRRVGDLAPHDADRAGSVVRGPGVEQAVRVLLISLLTISSVLLALVRLLSNRVAVRMPRDHAVAHGSNHEALHHRRLSRIDAGFALKATLDPRVVDGRRRGDCSI